MINEPQKRSESMLCLNCQEYNFLRCVCVVLHDSDKGNRNNWYSSQSAYFNSVNFYSMSIYLSSTKVVMVQQVVYWIIRRQARFQTPRQTSKRKYQKIFLRRLPLSRFVIKTLRVNEIAMKSFSKICFPGQTVGKRCEKLGSKAD